MSKFTFDIINIDGNVVEMEVEASRVTPDFVIGQRARLKALRTYGLENIPEDLVREVYEGNLGRITEIVHEETISTDGAFKEKMYAVRVEGR